MQVIATAGHVDHGKSALLRALTGMEPDRLAAERSRGMTIDLGYVWMTLRSGQQLAFVDVPGHSRFVPTMLAGLGPVPAVLFVVAADGGWMPQSSEHLAAVHALGISRGVLAVTRADLADPAPVLASSAAVLGRSSLSSVAAVAVSAVTGAGLPGLVAALAHLADGLPGADPASPVRIWADRAFHIAGSGTVVTGTLPAGAVSRGDELAITPSLRPVRVRGLQTLGEPVAQVCGPARVALNLRAITPDDVPRGTAIVQAGRWTLTSVIDVRFSAGWLAGPAAHGRWGLPRLATLHAGTARTPAEIRPLGPDLARLRLRDPLPLRAGDRVLLRDPGAAIPGRSAPGAVGRRGPRPDVPCWPGLVGALVLEVAPAPTAPQPARRPDPPAEVAAGIGALLADLAARPFSAPEADRLRELALGARELAAAARRGAILRLARQVVLAPGADLCAARLLAGIEQPFTAAAAKRALGSTRRTVIPLLEHLDRCGLTRRLADDRRIVCGHSRSAT